MMDGYAFESMSFRWGISDAAGSEHTINNRSFPLELQVKTKNISYNNVRLTILIRNFIGNSRYDDRKTTIFDNLLFISNNKL